jgi:DNA processing protein
MPQFSGDPLPRLLVEAAALAVSRTNTAEAWAGYARNLRGTALLDAVRSADAPASLRGACSAAADLVSEIASIRSRGIELIAAGGERYPEMLLHIHSPPPLLFCKGEVPECWPVCVAVVGSRSAGSPGCAFARTLARDLAASGVCIVSGFAAGIDGAAHRGAIEAMTPSARPPTIAVMGCGIDVVYPALHRALCDELIEHGGVMLSQFEPGTPPYPSNFLDRNRVIAGLCAATVVVEAARRSGALASARRALEADREVLAVPGPPLSALHEGCHDLIKAGARLCTCAEDVLELLSPSRAGDTQRPCADPGREALLSLIPGGEGIAVADLAAMCRSDCGPASGGGSLHRRLLDLELKGCVRILPGGSVIRIR